MRFKQHSQWKDYSGAASLSGFTLVELMVTLAIMVTVLGVAVPSFQNAMLSSKLGTQANNLVASAILARGEAIKRNGVVTLCVSTNGTSCAVGGWEQGWIILSGTDLIQRQQAAPSGFRITESGGLNSVSFQPTGVGATQTTLTVCRATPGVGSQERVVTISATGRPTVAKTSNGACP